MENSKRRWTHTEVKIAKNMLKSTLGNQTEAAEMLQKKLNRSLMSIKVKLCTLTKKHPSLRKKKNVEIEKAKSVQLSGKVVLCEDHIKIYF